MNDLPTETKSAYVAVLQSGNFTVGQANQLSGLFVSDDDDWRHLGWKNVRCFGVAVNPEDGKHLLLACGNGVHESRDAGTTWRVLTGWEITEVLDVSFDPDNLEHFVCATAFGVWESRDGGSTWSGCSEGLFSLFAPTLSISRAEGSIWTGTENGVYRMPLSSPASPAGDHPWQRDGLAGFAVRQIVTTEGGSQAAATHSQGAWVRTVGGPWTRIHGVPADAVCYAIAVDTTGRNIAVGGYFMGVYVSSDGGRSARLVTADAPDSFTHALAFSRKQLLVGTTDDGLFALDTSTGGFDSVWSRVGLAGTTIRKIVITTGAV